MFNYVIIDSNGEYNNLKFSVCNVAYKILMFVNNVDLTINFINRKTKL